MELKQVIIFIKNPILGKVKSRIAITEGAENALAIYDDLLAKCRLETLKVNAVRLLYYSDNIDLMDEWAAEHFEKHLQKQSNDLGIRMKDAFQKHCSKRPSKTIIIGSDCYDLTAEIIESAFDALTNHEIVIGPANDGGYYLLGMNNFHPEFFEGISWSTHTVLAGTIAVAEKNDLSIKLLEELIDLDTIDDVKKSAYSYPCKKKSDDTKNQGSY